jgi:hypothetical protein
MVGLLFVVINLEYLKVFWFVKTFDHCCPVKLLRLPQNHMNLLYILKKTKGIDLKLVYTWPHTPLAAKFQRERSLSVYQWQTVFSQVMSFLSQKKFRQCVNRYSGN